MHVPGAAAYKAEAFHAKARRRKENGRINIGTDAHSSAPLRPGVRMLFVDSIDNSQAVGHYPRPVNILLNQNCEVWYESCPIP